MTFAGIGIGPALGLAAVTAAALVGLHLLRVRPQTVRVVTTMFWAHAAERTRARTLVGRFRHPWTFALLLLFCWLIVAALTEPRSETSARRPAEVIVLDAGLSMRTVDEAGESRWQRATAWVRDRAKQAPASGTLAVVLAGEQLRLIHPFEKPAATLGPRLASSAPAQRPAALGDAVRLARALVEGRSDPRIVVVTDRERPGAFGPDETDVAIDRVSFGDSAANAAILSAHFVPNDRNPLRGELVARVGYWGEEPRDITLSISRGGGAPLLDETRSVTPGSTIDFRAQDLPADGDRIDVTIVTDDALDADNSAAYTMPLRTIIRVFPRTSVPLPLAVAIRSDPALQFAETAAEADLVLTRAADFTTGNAESDRPVVVIAANGAQAPTAVPIRVAGGESITEGLDFHGATCSAGASVGASIAGATPLLRAGDATLAAIVRPKEAGVSQLWLSEAFIDPASPAVRKPAFAVFIARALRSLSGWESSPVVLAPERPTVDPLWVARAEAEESVAIMPGSRAASDVAQTAADGAPTAAAGPPGGWGLEWFEVFLFLGVVVFAVESILHGRGRIS